jgi:hypothetical protein
MNITGTATLPFAAERVWNALLDPATMAACVPGCETMEETGPDAFRLALKIGVGAVSGQYEGHMHITEKSAPTRYAVAFEGGGAQGFVRGTGSAALQNGNGSTTVAYACEVEVGGLVASVGHRMLEGVAKFLIKQMFRKLETVIANGTAR